MPNLKGGSGYKKKKKGNGEEDIIIIADMEDDQMFGRVVKVLGNCNMLVYSEDGRERICHIRGKMRSRMYVHVGDIVIISTRGFEKNEPGKLPRGDICHKYETKHHSALRKKFPDINTKLFENLDAGFGKRDREDGFEFDGEAEDAGEEESESENTDNKPDASVQPNKQHTNQSHEIKSGSGEPGPRKHRPINLIEDDIDIDAI